jgi:hypothetical protein
MPQLASRKPPQLLPPFWPLEDQHGVDHVQLEGLPPANAERTMPLLMDIAALSEALRSLQTADGTSVFEQGAAVLSAEAADALSELAELVDDDSAALIGKRADALASRADAEAITRQIAEEGSAPPLEVVCGPLCTWRAKTRSPLHSFIAASHNEQAQGRLDAIDRALDGAMAELRDVLEAPKLYSKCAMAMHATDMIVSAGEAAAHPKHFAYFLPQDEGVDDLPLERQRTLYLHNVHLARFEKITAPLAEGLLNGPMRAAEVPIEATLAPWIRGHDHGHNLAVKGTEAAHDGLCETLGKEPFYMLGEAFANAYGFLMTVSRAWRGISGATRLEMCTTHIAELLHYMRRGPQHHSDPGSAYLELSFLSSEGFVEIDGSGRVHWDEDGLYRGMVALARALTRSIVAPTEEREAILFVDRYAWPADLPAGETPSAPAGETLRAMREELANVPTSIAFYRTSDVAAPESIAVAV